MFFCKNLIKIKNIAGNSKKISCLIYKNKKALAVFLLAMLFLLCFENWKVLTSNNYLASGNRNYIIKNYDDALKDYQYAETIDGKDSTVYLARLKRAEIFYQHMMLDEAEEELIKAFEENRVDYRAYVLLGDLYFSARRFGESIIYYNKALSLKNENAITIKLAKAFISKGDLNFARDIFLNLYLNDENEESAYYLGLVDFDKDFSYNDFLKITETKGSKKYGEEIKTIKDFIAGYDAERDKNYNAVNAANLYNKINEPYMAINKADSVAGDNPYYRDAWIVLGKSNFIIGDYKKSIDCLNKALELDYNNSETYFWLGSAYEKLNNEAESKAFFDKYKLLR